LKPRITSRKNPVLGRLRRLLRQARQRREEGLWVLEGVRLVGEALDSGLEPEICVVSPRLLNVQGGPALLERLEAAGRAGTGRPPLTAGDEALSWASAVEVGQGVVAAVRSPAGRVPLEEDGLVVVAAGLQDPGNLGALARIVEGAGAGGLFLLEGSVDPGNPKALRASAGSLLRLACEPAAWSGLLPRLQAAGYRIAAADGGGDLDHHRNDWTGAWALVLGGEGAGVPDEVRAEAEVTVRVPARRIESLNAAVAGAVILFEAARQRAAD